MRGGGHPALAHFVEGGFLRREVRAFGIGAGGFGVEVAGDPGGADDRTQGPERQALPDLLAGKTEFLGDGLDRGLFARQRGGYGREGLVFAHRVHGAGENVAGRGQGDQFVGLGADDHGDVERRQVGIVTVLGHDLAAGAPATSALDDPIMAAVVLVDDGAVDYAALADAGLERGQVVAFRIVADVIGRNAGDLGEGEDGVEGMSGHGGLRLRDGAGRGAGTGGRRCRRRNRAPRRAPDGGSGDRGRRPKPARRGNSGRRRRRRAC